MIGKEKKRDPIESYRWKQASRRFRKKHPLCRICERRGIVTLGTLVDHIVPRHTAPELMWEESNWQTLCSTCHSMDKQSIERIGYDKRAVGDDGWPTDVLHPANKKI